MKTLRNLKRLITIALVLRTCSPFGFSAGELVSEPFTNRSTPDGGTMFTELSPDRTGIVTTNRYDDPRMWEERHTEHNVGAIGTGVAVGDYDRDGKPDVFVVSKVESGRLFRNLGDWRFEDTTLAAGVADDNGEWKQGAAFVDVDNDGWLDLYVCRFEVPNQLFINQQDGTFRDEAKARGLAVVDASSMACFADYDRDGWLDVFIQTNLRDVTVNTLGERDYLFRNRGDGTFENVTDAAGILAQPTQGHSATWWDQNQDGWLDLYVANDFSPPDFLYRNNHDGTFTNTIDAALPHTPFSSMGSDFGDVDNDGRIDFFVADMAGTTHEFTQRGLSDTRAQLDDTQNEKLNTAIQFHSNVLYLNTGTSRSMEAAFLAGIPGTDWTWSPRFVDLNSDGFLDLFVTNGMDREHNNLDFIVRKLTAVNLHDRIRITKAYSVLNQANLAYANRGNLQFEEVGKAWGLDKVGVSFGSAFGDFDGDGDLDVIFTNYKEGATVLRNDSQTGNNIIIALRGIRSNRFGLGARVEVTTDSGIQVRQLASARGYQSTSEPVAHFGLGEDHVIERLRLVWPSGQIQEVDGLAAGNRYTITEPAQSSSAARPKEETANGVYFEEISDLHALAFAQREEDLEGTVPQPLLPRRFNRRGPGLAVSDISGDGIDEIVVGGTAVDGARILGRDQLGYQMLDTGIPGIAPPINEGPPLIFDANGDGANDILFTGGGAALPAEEPEYEPRLWLNDGTGKFSRAPKGTLPSLPICTGAAIAADFDRDGKLDLFLGGRLFPGYYPEPAFSALLFQRNGQLVDNTDNVAPDLREAGLITSALASDVDDDGWIDLILATEWRGVRVFKNRQGRALEDMSNDWGFDTAGSGLWTSLAAADFNHDGRLDYAIGNQGLNTIYSAPPGHSMRLYSGQFKRGGEPQLILAYNINGDQFPVISRREMGAKIPTVLKRFRSNDKYAAATLEEILGKDALTKADIYEADQLQSGVLLSQPSGRFVFEPLPRHAQIAPMQGMVAEDFNGDGYSDLLLATNDYSPIPAQGRWGGGVGWLLLGKSEGASLFEVIPPEESGWLVAGNAKALVRIDIDHDAKPDAIVSQNNQSTLAFRNQSHGDHIAVALRLRGAGGNPDAIGARVVLEIAGQPVQISEIHAGGGYASQSTPTVFFSARRDQAPDALFRIRWPSGESSEISYPEGDGYLLIEQ